MANGDKGSKERKTKSEKTWIGRKEKKKDIEDNRGYGERSLSSHVRFSFIYSIQGLSHVLFFLNTFHMRFVRYKCGKETELKRFIRCANGKCTVNATIYRIHTVHATTG